MRVSISLRAKVAAFGLGGLALASVTACSASPASDEGATGATSEATTVRYGNPVACGSLAALPKADRTFLAEQRNLPENGGPSARHTGPVGPFDPPPAPPPLPVILGCDGSTIVIEDASQLAQAKKWAGNGPGVTICIARQVYSNMRQAIDLCPKAVLPILRHRDADRAAAEAAKAAYDAEVAARPYAGVLKVEAFGQLITAVSAELKVQIGTATYDLGKAYCNGTTTYEECRDQVRLMMTTSCYYTPPGEFANCTPFPTDGKHPNDGLRAPETVYSVGPDVYYVNPDIGATTCHVGTGELLHILAPTGPIPAVPNMPANRYTGECPLPAGPFISGPAIWAALPKPLTLYSNGLRLPPTGVLNPYCHVTDMPQYFRMFPNAGAAPTFPAIPATNTYIGDCQG